MGLDVTEVQKALKGVDYPASKEDLADHASSNGGSDEVVEALRNADGDSFEGPSGVMAAIKDSLGDD